MTEILDLIKDRRSLILDVYNESDVFSEICLFDFKKVFDDVPLPKGVKIISGISDITYLQLCYQLQHNHYYIEFMLFEDFSAITQIHKTAEYLCGTIHEKNPESGCIIIIPFNTLPVRDNVGAIEKLRISNDSFKLDHLCRIYFSLPGLSKVRIKFYPKLKGK